MSQFDDFLKGVTANLTVLGKQGLEGYSDQVKAMAQAALDKAEINLQLWTAQLALGQLSQAEFKSLVQGETDLAEIAGLTAGGIALAEAQRLRDAVTLSVIEAALTSFPVTPRPN